MNCRREASGEGFVKSVSLAVALAALLVLGGIEDALAGLKGQPKPPAEAVAAIRKASVDILGTGDLGKARPILFTTVETHVTADLTDLLAAVVRDDTAYNGLVSTFEEAIRAGKGEAATFAAYNLARLHLLRARHARTTPVRNAVLKVAAATAATFAKGDASDPAAWELLGDIHSEQGNIDAAVVAYGKIAESGATAAASYAQLKIATAYRLANRYSPAEDAYKRGIRADATGGNSGREILHRLYQGLTLLYADRGNFPAAAQALSLSARVTQDPAAPYRLRLDAAQRLLRRGYVKEVLAYSEAAARLSPDDAAAQALRDQARAARR